MKRKLFVIICTHNGEKFIKEQIDSIYLANENFEILVYDFGSQDNTLNICEEYSRLRNLKVHSYKFAPGAKKSFMFALNEFKRTYHSNYKDYLIFLSDQDDIWSKKKFIEVRNKHNIIDNELPQFVHHNVQLIDTFGDKILKSFYNYSESVIRKRYTTLYFSVVVGHTISMNKRFIELLTTFSDEEIIMHDWWLSIIADLNHCRYYIDNKLSYYRIHSDNIYGLNKSGTNINKKVKNYISNCKTITKQRNKILTDYKEKTREKEIFFKILKTLLLNFRFKLLLLVLGQKIFKINE